MRRHFSLSKFKASSVAEPATASSEKSLVAESTEQGTSTTSTTSTIRAALPPPNLKVKKVDHYFSRWQKKWKYVNTGTNIIPELRNLPETSSGGDDPWQAFCFVVIREVPREEEKEPYFKIHIKSPYLLQACKEVIKELVGLSWTAVPLQVDPQVIIAFYPQFVTYRDTLKAKDDISEEETYLLATVDVLIDYVRKDYRVTLASIDNLTSHGEITFQLLYAIMLPRSILVTTCPLTGELEALKVISGTQICSQSGLSLFVLVLEGIGLEDVKDPSAQTFMRIQTRLVIPDFDGVVKINSLEAYPIQFHPSETELRQSFIDRGRKWSKLAGIHHASYKGTSGVRTKDKIIKYNVNGRIMIDRGNFRRLNPNYPFPMAKPDVVHKVSSDRLIDASFPPSQTQESVYQHIPLHGETKRTQEPIKLTDDDLLLAPPIVWGFSLADKLWLEFDVTKIEPIEWNEEAFVNLVLPSDRKMLLQSLVEAHNAELSGFDDFIKGKGRGLVINLFGPPGVGKTMSAEATSEHVKRPLYVVGAGDLGTRAEELDKSLQQVFELATAWKAIVLIDEADVFLERRSLYNLERNALVAVFLRHLEYYPAILFMTTNRVKTFDEAFLSRIHVALHFQSLEIDARLSVWTAFLEKAGVQIGAEGSISREQLKRLSERDVNGRQVKNATRTAQSLALSRRETLQFSHIVEVLGMMDQFTTDFMSMTIDVEAPVDKRVSHYYL